MERESRIIKKIIEKKEANLKVVTHQDGKGNDVIYKHKIKNLDVESNVNDIDGLLELISGVLNHPEIDVNSRELESKFDLVEQNQRGNR